MSNASSARGEPRRPHTDCSPLLSLGPSRSETEWNRRLSDTEIVASLCQEGPAVPSSCGTMRCIFLSSCPWTILSRLDVGIDSVAIVSTVGQKSPEGDINCSSVASSGDRYEMKAYAGEF